MIAYARCFLLLMFAIALALTGCARKGVYSPGPQPPDRPPLQVPEEIPECSDDLDAASLLLAIDRSLKYYDGIGRNQTFRIGDRQVSVSRMKESLVAFRRIFSADVSIEEKRRQIAEKFVLLRASGERGDGAILFTGYYQPLLEGSLKRTEKYRYPLYKTPPDLIVEKGPGNRVTIGRKKNGRIIPYYTRREIDIEGVLKGKGLELIWVSDPAELNSLHTQGSGKIKLEDGTLLTVGYAKNNGWPYRSVTQNLLDRNKIEKGNASYRNFKVWLKGKSDGERDEILSYNERYIFFRFLDRDPIGALGEPVTPGRSIATDPDYFPKGALAFIRLRKPILDADGRPSRRVPFSRFVLLQDKGSAIKGPGRVDLFCGFGPDAQATAGTLKENGELYVLIPR